MLRARKGRFSVTILMLLSLLLWAPAAGAYAASAEPNEPFGHFDSLKPVGGGLKLRGWAIDPDTTNPIYVWVTVDGVGQHLYANASRPDVGRAYPEFGAKHGFSGVIKAGPGRHTVCVTASNVGPGHHQSLGCRKATVSDGSSPVGDFSSASPVDAGIAIRGWAIDPDTTDPIYVWVTVDGAGRHLYANVDRPGITEKYPDYGTAHGFESTLSAASGAHRVCVTASNVGGGSHTNFGCKEVDVGASAGGPPFGNFERASGVEGGIEIKGWAIDPDTPDPIYMWVVTDGAGQHVYASAERTDVGRAFPEYGSDHGFLARIAASPGSHRICVTASNVGAGTHTSLGCRDANVPESVVAGAYATGDAGDTSTTQVASTVGADWVGYAVGAVLVDDSMGRSVESGWGSAPTGGSYAASPVGAFSVSGGRGLVAVGSGQSRAATLGSVSSTNTEAVVDLAVGEVPTSGSGLTSAVVFRAGSAGEYQARVRVAPDGFTSASVRRFNADGSQVDVGHHVVVPGTVAAGSWLRVRAQVVHSDPVSIRLKVWPAGSA